MKQMLKAALEKYLSFIRRKIFFQCRFETDAEGGIGKIFVFYPKKDLKIDDGYHTMSIIFGTTAFATECGDYISVDLLGDDEFCIVETPDA